MDELKRIYRQAVAGRIRTLEAALAALADQPAPSNAAIRREAHALRGSGGTYGFPEVSAAAAGVEDAAPDALAAATGVLLAVLRDVAGAGAVARILVVDDDPEMQLVLRYALSADGREVVFAGSGAEAESLLAAGSFDLILLDLVLPDIDGRRLLARLRDLPAVRSVPVIVLSGRSTAEARSECLALGAAGFIAKPFDPADVAAAVTAQLSRG